MLIKRVKIIPNAITNAVPILTRNNTTSGGRPAITPRSVNIEHEIKAVIFTTGIVCVGFLLMDQITQAAEF